MGEGGGDGLRTCAGEGKGGVRVEVVTGDEGGEEEGREGDGGWCGVDEAGRRRVLE